MDAIGFLCLILFFIGLGLAVYYAYICYDVPSSRTHTILHSEDGPWLKYPNDFNGNESVVVPLQRIDEPDVHNPALTLEENGAPVSNCISEKTSPSAPDCSSKQEVATHCEVEHVQLEREVSDSRHVLLDMETPRPIANSDEEDGLERNQDKLGLVATMVASHRLKAYGNSEKHVHFPYIDTGDDEIAEGTSCDQPTTTVSNVQMIMHAPDSRVDRLNETKSREPISMTVTKGCHNPIDDIKVRMVTYSSSQSSCEELRTRSSDTDTSEPDVTEYSFVTGPKVPTTSEILADEISSCLEPKVTKIAPLIDSMNSNGGNSSSRPVSSSDSCNSDSSEGVTCLPSEEQLSINTPPNTPPETDPRAVINNPSAKLFVTQKTSKNDSFIVVKNYRSSSVSSNSSLSADEHDIINSKASVSLLKK